MSTDHMSIYQRIESGAARAGLAVQQFVETTTEGRELGRQYNDAIRGVEDASAGSARNLAWRIIEDEARKAMMAEPGLSFSECVSRVLAAQPHLASAHLREMRDGF